MGGLVSVTVHARQWPPNQDVPARERALTFPTSELGQRLPAQRLPAHFPTTHWPHFTSLPALLPGNGS